MAEIKILILENNTCIIENYEKTIGLLERDNKILFIPFISHTLEEAKNIIETTKIDIAIIDLNLDHTKGSDNDDGNEAIRELKDKFRLPIYVLSGEPEKLADDLKDIVNLYPKSSGKSTPEIFLEMYKDLQSIFIKYFSREGYLEQLINKFYWEHLYKTMDSWEKVEKMHATEINKILSRHTISCLNEKFYVNGNIGSFDKYHPGEMYIIPPIKEHYHTGDIIEFSNEKYIIVNPACDIVNKDKMEFYTLAKIYKASQIPKIKAKSEANQITYINDNLRNVNKLDRYHFLPKFDKINDDYVIDFQYLSTIPIGNTTSNTNHLVYIAEREGEIKDYLRIASIASPFLKDVIARFSNYYARQGQPNLL